MRRIIILCLMICIYLSGNLIGRTKLITFPFLAYSISYPRISDSIVAIRLTFFTDSDSGEIEYKSFHIDELAFFTTEYSYYSISKLRNGKILYTLDGFLFGIEDDTGSANYKSNHACDPLYENCHGGGLRGGVNHLMVNHPYNDSLIYVFLAGSWAGKEWFDTNAVGSDDKSNFVTLAYNLKKFKFDNKKINKTKPDSIILIMNPERYNFDHNMKFHVTGCYHKNGKDIWIVFYSSFLKGFQSFLLDNRGFNYKTPVKSGFNFQHSDYRLDLFLDPSKDGESRIKLSPDGSKLVIYDHFLLYILPFNNNTGVVGNKPILKYGKPDSSFYPFLGRHNILDCIFSSDGSKLYLSIVDSITIDSSSQKYIIKNQKILQYDINKNKFTTIMNLEYDRRPYRYMLLGPDGRIYLVARERRNLPRINNPNQPGFLCNFQDSALHISYPDKVLYPPVEFPSYMPGYLQFRAIASSNSPVCFGKELELKAEIMLNSIYEWQGPDGFSSNMRNPIIKNATEKNSGKYILKVSRDGQIAYDTIEVKVNPKALAGIKGDTIICQGEKAYLEAIVTVPKCKYLWSTGELTNKISIENEGVYSVTATDENGCQFTDSITVKMVKKPEVKILGPEQVCLNSEYEYQAKDTMDGDYYWEVTGGKIVSENNNKTVKVIWEQAGSGNLKISKTDKITGCIGTFTKEIKIESFLKPVIESTKSVLCSGSYVEITAPSGYQTYLWNTGDTTRVIRVSNGGKYIVTVIDKNGCEGVSDTLEIKQAEPPTPQITGSEYICPGRTSSLLVNDSYPFYRWSTGDTSRQITIDQAGTYSVTVTDTNGCEGTVSFEVKEYEVMMTGLIAQEFGKVSLGKSGIAVGELKVKNESKTDLEILNINSKNYPDIFKISTKPTLPHTLKEDEEVEIAIRFKPTEAKIYEDSLIIETGKPCWDVLASPIRGEGIKVEIQSKVWLPDTTARIGTENYRLPLKGKLSQDTTLNELSYKAEIRIAEDYYLPEALTKGSLEGDVIEKGERVIRIRGNVATISGNETVLTEITGLVLLGRPEPAMLKISSFEWSDSEIKVMKEDGSLKVEGVCNQGFSGIEMTERISFEIAENPVREELKLIIRGKISEGANKIRIYNTLGECVLVEQASMSVQRLDVSSLPPGVYFVRLGENVMKFVKI